MDFVPLRPGCMAGGIALVVLTLAIVLCAACVIPVASASGEPEGETIAVSVYVDIRPGLCPNHLRLESTLTIPVAILGTMDFEVVQIHPLELVRRKRRHSHVKDDDQPGERAAICANGRRLWRRAKLSLMQGPLSRPSESRSRDRAPSESVSAEANQVPRPSI